MTRKIYYHAMEAKPSGQTYQERGGPPWIQDIGMWLDRRLSVQTNVRTWRGQSARTLLDLEVDDEVTEGTRDERGSSLSCYYNPVHDKYTSGYGHVSSTAKWTSQNQVEFLMRIQSNGATGDSYKTSHRLELEPWGETKHKLSFRTRNGELRLLRESAHVDQGHLEGRDHKCRRLDLRQMQKNQTERSLATSTVSTWTITRGPEIICGRRDENVLYLGKKKNNRRSRKTGYTPHWLNAERPPRTQVGKNKKARTKKLKLRSQRGPNQAEFQKWQLPEKSPFPLETREKK